MPLLCSADSVQCSQFWLSWGINAGVAAGTFAAAFAAIFGEWLKSKLFRPKLDVVLSTNRETLSTIKLPDESGQRREHAVRWYHLAVRNRRRWPTATEVQINLLRIEQRGYDDEWQEVWRGLAPMRWRFQEVLPITRTVGPIAEFDVCTVVQNKYLQLMLLFEIPSIPVRYQDEVTLIISVQAASSESESPVRRFKISWNGSWSDSDEEMNRNLTIKPVT